MKCVVQVHINIICSKFTQTCGATTDTDIQQNKQKMVPGEDTDRAPIKEILFTDNVLLGS
jgi:hypothetical protein